MLFVGARNAFVSFDGFELITLCNLCLQEVMKSSFSWCGFASCLITRGFSLELVKFLPWGHVSAPTGVVPEALEEWNHSSKGYEHYVCLVGWVPGPHSVRFSRPRRYFSRHRHSTGNATCALFRPVQTARRACKGGSLIRKISPPGDDRFVRGCGLLP